MVLMRVRDEDAVAGRCKVQRFRQEVARILRRVEWPAHIKDDAVATRRDEFDAVTADLMCSPMDGKVDLRF